jgi:hypothetical protein
MAGLPGGNPYPLTLSPSYQFPTSGTYLTSPSNLHATYVDQWNLTVQRQVTANWLVSASYLGSDAIHLWSSQALDPANLHSGELRRRTVRPRRPRALFHDRKRSCAPHFDAGEPGPGTVLRCCLANRRWRDGKLHGPLGFSKPPPGEPFHHTGQLHVGACVVPSFSNAYSGFSQARYYEQTTNLTTKRSMGRRFRPV